MRNYVCTLPTIGAATLIGILLGHSAKAQSPSATQVVMLGTGTPSPDPDRFGPATAVVVNGTAYLVDVGAGVVRRAKAAALDKPKLLVLYHASISLRPRVNPNFQADTANSSPEELLAEVQSRYDGKVVVARDLDVY